MQLVYLAIAILAEIVGTSALKAADGFRVPLPSVVVVAAYAVSFYFLSLALRTIPIGLAYAIWSGVGIVLISLVGWMVYRQALDAAAVAGIVLIVAGVIVINVFSKSMPH